MTSTTTIILVIIAYQVVLLGIGWWASRRNNDNEDFYLGGRKLGPVVASLSAATSSSSAWSLLGVSGAAFAWGIQAIWLIPAVLSGFLINWYLVAPRLHRQSHANGAVTVVEFIAGDDQQQSSTQQKRIRLIGALIILFSFAFYIAAQFQAAGSTFARVLPVTSELAIIIGAVVVLAYVWLGGFWAASVTDALQGFVMLAVAMLLPTLALIKVGGFNELLAGLQALNDPGLLAIVNQPGLLTAMLFVAGLFGIGFGYPGQPHVVNRFMAMADSKQIPTARRIAIAWGVIIFAGMVVLGLCGRVLLSGLENREDVLLAVGELLLHPVMAGVVIAGVLSAIMSTADSQLLTAASAVSHDMQHSQMNTARWVVLGIGFAAIILAIFFPEAIFSRVLFAWQALGAAFGPVLMVMLWRGPIQSNWKMAAILTGFLATIVISFLPNAPGDSAERWIPLILATVLALIGSSKASAR